MDRITDALDRLEELSADEIAALREEIVNEFKSLSEVPEQDLTREVVDQMESLANAHDTLSGEETRRAEESAALASARNAASSRILGEDVPAEGEVEDAPESDETTDVAVEDAEEAPAVDEEVKEDEDDIDPETGKKRVFTTESVNDTSESPVVEETPVTELSTDTAEVAEEAAPVTASAEADTTETAPETEAVVASGEEAVEVEDDSKEETPEVSEADVEAEDKSEEVTSEDAALTEKEEDTPVTAAANNDLEVEIEVSDDRRPAVTKVAAPVVITAGADIQGLAAGSELTSLRQVAQALIDRKKSMGRTSGGDGEQHTVATFTTTFPEERTLSSVDLDGNSRKVDEVVGQEALVAAGGICAPVEVSYDIFGFGELGRPVRDSLAVFSADRGGIRFVTPPTLVDLNGSVSLWTLQDDIDAATAGAPDPVKPCLRVACGAEVVVYIDAIPLCLTFGNMGARAYPELVERHTELGMIWHARYAETRLLTRIGALSTAVSTAKQLGIARDYFVAVDRAAAAYRSRHRLADDATLRVIVPGWFKNALRADLTKQAPGDTIEATFNLTEATIRSFFVARNIEVTWAWDGETGQIFGAQAAGALLDFPANLIWYLFAEGTFLFLDGGTLDLGLVRDSTLNGTNDYKIFLETFEGVAKVGIEALRVTTQLSVAGSYANGQTVTV